MNVKALCSLVVKVLLFGSTKKGAKTLSVLWKEKKLELESQQTVFRKQTHYISSVLRARYRVAHLLVTEGNLYR